MLVRGKREPAVYAIRLFPMLVLLLVCGLGVIGVGYFSLIHSDHAPVSGKTYATTQTVIIGLLVLSIVAFILLILTTIF